MSGRILLIEDDARLAGMVSDYLGEAGFSVAAAATGGAGIGMQARDEPDAIILDLMLPDMDGLEVCRRIRARSDTPILMLTARGDTTDRVVGLELGADDYLPKPFEPRELLARLKAILRRDRSRKKSDILRFGRLEIDTGAREVRVDGEARTLTSYQFALLTVARRARRSRALARHADGPDEGRTAGSLRSLHRRSHLAHSRRNRGRPEEAAARHHRARRGLRLRQGPGLETRD